MNKNYYYKNYYVSNKLFYKISVEIKIFLPTIFIFIPPSAVFTRTMRWHGQLKSKKHP